MDPSAPLKPSDDAATRLAGHPSAAAVAATALAGGSGAAGAAGPDAEPPEAAATPPGGTPPPSWRTSLGVLAEAAAGGPAVPGPAWTRLPRPGQRRAGLHWFVWGAVLVGMFAATWGNLLGFAGGTEHLGDCVIVAALMASSLPFLSRSVMVAWRIQTVALVWVLLVSRGDHIWPWPVTVLLVYGLVLVMVGERHRTSMLLGVWIWSAAALWVSGRGAAGWAVGLLAAAAAAALFAGHARRELATAETKLAATSAQRDAESAQRAVLAERARIARELHDVVAHHMSMIAIQAEAAPLRAPELPPEALQAFAVIRDAAREALAETRGIVGLLRSEDGGGGDRRPAPGVAQIGDLVAGARASGLDADLTVSGSVAPVPAAVGLATYRLVQEGLSNAARHAPGSRVEVGLDYGPDRLAVTVRNSAPAGGGWR
jgi:signal transduction histidine kinase